EVDEILPNRPVGYVAALAIPVQAFEILTPAWFDGVGIVEILLVVLFDIGRIPAGQRRGADELFVQLTFHRIGLLPCQILDSFDIITGAVAAVRAALMSYDNRPC